MTTRRLMSWNILEGFFVPHARENEPRVTDETRLTAGTILIQRTNPDILVLNEALHCEPAFGQHRDYGALFGFPHLGAKLYDGSWGNVILSRFPIRDIRNLTIHRSGSRQNRGMLAVLVALPEGDLWVATYHPHPHRRPWKRAEDFEEFLISLSGPLLLCGDLNAISPEDGIDGENLTRAFEAFQKPDDARRSVERFLEAGRLAFTETFPKLGLRDAVPETSRGYTIPTPMLNSSLDSAMRIDHILASSGINIVAAGPVRSGEADVASDHYPVFADFSLVSGSLGT